MKSLHATLALIAFWACLYLPGLGSREIRGEEWRRTLPGRTMLNTGEWLVPYSGGLPYLRKPPLINWMSAASFKLTGVRNEWTARLPSVLVMLVAVLGIHAFARCALGDEAAFVGTVFFMTSLGVIEKGRIAELEVYYIAFTGLAFSAWLAGFMGRLNRWASWLWAGFFLGLGMLAKGPMHLLFFYALVVGACWKTMRWRELWAAPHAVGLALCMAMFLAWAVPFVGAYGRLVGVSGWDVVSAWQNEVARRVTGEEETSGGDWLLRGPRALTMFLPWIVFVPVWWKRQVLDGAFTDKVTRKLFSGLCWGAAGSFALMVLLPSSSARYVAPLLAPVALLSGWLCMKRHKGSAERHTKVWHRSLQIIGTLLGLALLGSVVLKESISAPSVVNAVVGLAALVFFPTLGWARSRVHQAGFSAIAAFVAMLAVNVMVGARTESTRPVALAIGHAMQPKDAPLYVFHLGQVPYPFYLPPDSIELFDLGQLPESGVRWMLTTAKVDEEFRPWFERRYGTATKAGEFTGTWGGADQDDSRRMVLLRFAGR